MSLSTSFRLAEIDSLPKADVRFSTVSALLAYLAEMTDNSIDSVTVSHIEPRYFPAINEALQNRDLKTRILFLAEHKLLIIAFPTGHHEQLHLLLDQEITGQIRDMGLKKSWKRIGATRYPIPTIEAASQGEGDGGGGPWPKRFLDNPWPTIVLEAGYSQSLDSLRTKIRFWFARSNHAVKIVLLAKAFPHDHAQKRIVIEQWQECYVPVDVALARPGATRTCLSAMTEPVPVLQPVCLQTINIVWAVAGVAYDQASTAQRLNSQSFSVVSGPLRLEFACLFLRLPVGPREQDVVLSEQYLQEYAAMVWI